jgi:hypothetical protein
MTFSVDGKSIVGDGSGGDPELMTPNPVPSVQSE